MCLLETALDYEAIVKSAQGRFPYAYYVVTDLDTPPTDPTDQNGETPAVRPSLPGVDPGVIQSIYDCVAQNCTTTGDMNGTISTTNCLSGACAGPFVQIYYQGQQQDACFDCIIGSANSEYPLAKGRDECTNDAREPFAYGGMNGTLMLSRYPLANQQAFVLPGTGYRRAILYAQVQLEDQVVDFFCGQLMSPLVDGVLPYVGNYGKDVTNQENGWEDEQFLQARKTVGVDPGDRRAPRHRRRGLARDDGRDQGGGRRRRERGPGRAIAGGDPISIGASAARSSAQATRVRARVASTAPRRRTSTTRAAVCTPRTSRPPSSWASPTARRWKTRSGPPRTTESR